MWSFVGAESNIVHPLPGNMEPDYSEAFFLTLPQVTAM